jgi:phage shock protein C
MRRDLDSLGGRPAARRFRLDRANGKLMGVSAGIAAWTRMPTGFVRIAFVLGALFSFGTAALLYLAIGLIAD